MKTYFKLHNSNNFVNDTQLPSINVLRPTVGVKPLRQATYRAQANQCNFSPF